MKRAELYHEPASGLRPARVCARTPFALKDAMAGVPYRAWDSMDKVWWWPADRVDPQALYDALFISRPDMDAWVRARVQTSAWAGLTPPSYAHITPRDPATARRPLWEHQRLGYAMLMNQPATLLWWDMGVGKTAPVLHVAATVRGLVLIVCPKIVCPVWPRQLAEHTTLGEDDYLALDLSGVSNARAATMARQAIEGHRPGRLTMIVANHARVAADPLASVLAAVPAWSMVVADESHYIKNAAAKVTKHMVRRIAPRADRRVCLTGTFVPKDLLDAHGQYAFLDRSIFGESAVPFRSRYGVYGGFEGRELVGYRNLPEFNARVFSIAHAVSKRQVHDLPPVTQRTIPVTLSPAARAAYARLYKDLVLDVESGRVTAANAAVRAVHLQKITSGFIEPDADADGDGGPRACTVVDTAKRDALAEWMDEAGYLEPLVVFCHFRRDLDTVREVATEAGRRYSEISGRRHDVSAVWEPGTGDVLGVQIQAGGVGIDLTASAYACYYSVGHNGGAYQQSMARLDRPGQTRSVEYTFLIAEGTVDEAVHAALQGKNDLSSALFDWARGATHTTHQEALS